MAPAAELFVDYQFLKLRLYFHIYFSCGELNSPVQQNV